MPAKTAKTAKTPEADDDVWTRAIETGIEVDYAFAAGHAPTFGDLILLAGSEPGREFPPSGHFSAAALAKLGFESHGDDLGIPNDSGKGDKVMIWLCPVQVAGAVDGHPGHDSGLSGLRLSFSVLRNPSSRVARFVRAISECAAVFDSAPIYRLRKTDLRVPANLARLRKDIKAIDAHWRAQGLIPGSPAALAHE